MIDGEWIESLENDGVGSDYVNPREKIIADFVAYYTNFEAGDEW